MGEGPAYPLDAIIAEIGSTTTVVTGLVGLNGKERQQGLSGKDGGGGPQVVGQGMAPTTATSGDVTVGLDAATRDLATSLGYSSVVWDEMLVASSAAGGLQMTVHGLVHEMTAKAAKEAALGAGAVVRMVTSGILSEQDLEEIAGICPNIILLAGGVEYGDRETVEENARRLADLMRREGLFAPVIFAGNVAARETARHALEGIAAAWVVVDNVYPKVDRLNVEPTRMAIQKVFEEHIVGAPGMDKVRRQARGKIMPTPGAVMAAARLLYQAIGDLLVIDVGGATTDVHSVTPGSDDTARISVGVEPLAKRSVEGDLGVFVNARNVAERIGEARLTQEFGVPVETLWQHLAPVPTTDLGRRFVLRLTQEAVLTAVDRHVGRIRSVFGPSGRIQIAEGKDLAQVRWIIGTGGALTRIPGAPEILGAVRRGRADPRLLPPGDARVAVDRRYLMAPLGVLAAHHPDAALKLLLESLDIGPDQGHNRVQGSSGEERSAWMQQTD